MLARLEPSHARRTLGVILAPNGDGKPQIDKSLHKAQTFLGKIKHSKLTSTAKWTAITSIMEPKVSYPLMATLFEPSDLDQIERVITRAKCNALGLNTHFPHAVLHSPLKYGGMAIPTTLSRTATTRIIYFLYHIRQSSKVGIKLDASVTFLQLEIGIFQSFLLSPYESYGYLATKTLIKNKYG